MVGAIASVASDLSYDLSSSSDDSNSIILQVQLKGMSQSQLDGEMDRGAGSGNPPRPKRDCDHIHGMELLYGTTLNP